MRWCHLALMAALVAPVAGCAAPDEGPPVAASGGQPGATGALAAPAADDEDRRRQFENCMREQGAPLADRGGERREPPTAGPEADRMNAALERCRGLLPGGGVPPRPTLEDIERALDYARCIRDNGVPYYPDPDPETGRAPLTTELGDRLKRDPRFAAAEEACRGVLPQIDPHGANG